MERITVHGMSMPKLGLGTFRLTGSACAEAVQSALGIGYRHIDTAEMYGNEDGVGEGMAHGGVSRRDIHLTTKVWWDHLADDGIARAAEASLKKLRTDYVDLYLIHWPAAGMDLKDAVTKLGQIQHRGLARHVGVCNFPSALFRQAVAAADVPIVCNQFEYSVLLGQKMLVEATRGEGAAVIAYSPLAQGRLAEQDSLKSIARKHGATPAQVALKWLLDQDDVAAIPKAGRRETQQANLDSMNVTLDDLDRAEIARLPKDQRFVQPGFAPQWDMVG